MEIIAISSGNQVRAPPPFKCEAGRGEGFYAGYWDTETGSEVADIPYSNSNGRTDTEGEMVSLVNAKFHSFKINH